MIIRSVDKSPEITITAQTTPTAGTKSVEITRTKIMMVYENLAGSSGVHGRGVGGSLWSPSHQLVTDGHSQSYVGVGFIGSILLITVGCVFFQLCRSKFRHDSPANSRRRNEEISTSTGQDHQTPTGGVGEVGGAAAAGVPVAQGVRETSSEDELSRLVTAHRHGEPARNCILSVATDSSVLEDTTPPANDGTTRIETCLQNTFPASRPVESADEDKKSHHQAAARDDNPNRWNTVSSENNGGFGVTDDISNDRSGDHAFDIPNPTTELEVSLQTDRESDVSEYLASLVLDVTSEKTDDVTDRESDVSEYLASLVLDVTSEKTNDVMEREKNHADFCRELGGDDLPSDESFSRLQDVKAQAEFSPYHLAWHTPMVQQRQPHYHQRQPTTDTAAKKLDMDLFSRSCSAAEPTVILKEANQSVTHKFRLEEKGESTLQSSDEATSPDSAVFGDWDLLKSDDMWYRPASPEYHTPRPPACRQQRRNVEALTALDNNGECLPLLPYSVTEYRRSLKNIAGGLDSSVNSGRTKESPCKLLSASHSSSSSVSSDTYPSSSHSGSATISNTPVTDLDQMRSSVQIHVVDWDELDHTPQNTQWRVGTGLETPRNEQGQVPINLNSTLADLEGQGHSSGSNTADSSLTDSGKNHQANEEAALDTLNNNVNIVMSNTNNGSSLSPAESSIPPSTPSPSSATSSSEMTSFSEKCSISISDEVSPRNTTGSHVKAEAEDGNDQMLQTEFSPEGRMTTTRTSSPRHLTPRDCDNFKVPLPVDNPRSRHTIGFSLKKSEAAAAMTGLPRSKSSTGHPLSHHPVLGLDSSQPPLRRSRTDDSISSSSQNLPRLMSMGSWSDVSVAGSSASRLSLQDGSLTWDHEFTSSCRAVNESLTWEDDPYLH